MEKTEGKKVRRFPVRLQVVLENTNRPDLVERGVVEMIGNDMVETLTDVVLPDEPGEDRTYSVNLKPAKLNLPGPKRFRLCATERINEGPPKSVKVFCYPKTSNRPGGKPVAFYLDERAGIAKMVGDNLVVIYANERGGLTMCRVWVDGNTAKMRPISFAYDMVLKKYRETMREELLEGIKWALNTDKEYAEAMLLALDKVWSSNGYAHKLYAVRKERKPVSAPETKPAPADDSAKELVSQVNETENIVSARLKGDAPEDVTPPHMVKDPVEEARSEKMTEVLTAPTQPGGQPVEEVPAVTTENVPPAEGKKPEEPRGKGHDKRSPRQKAAKKTELEGQPA